MKIVCQIKKRMTLEAFAEENDLTFVIAENDNVEYTVAFSNIELKRGKWLISPHGRGKILADVISTYCEEISNELMILNAYDRENRREIQVPTITGHSISIETYRNALQNAN